MQEGAESGNKEAKSDCLHAHVHLCVCVCTFAGGKGNPREKGSQKMIRL